MRVTLDQLLSRMNQHKGALMGVLVSHTQPKLFKTLERDGQKSPCPWPSIFCIATRSVCFGAVYESSVNLQRGREGKDADFTARGLWKSKKYPEGAGERDGPYTVRHKETGERYFGVRPRPHHDGTPVILESHYLDDQGLPVADMQVLPWLVPPSKPTNQGLDKTVPWRTIALRNVLEVHLFGEIFVVTDNAHRLAI